MKERQARHQWDDADEADFVKALEKELDKIVRFQENKIAELAKLIDQYEGEVKSLIATDEHRAEEEDIGFEDGASDTSEDNEDRFVELEEDLANVIADVHDLGEPLVAASSSAGHLSRSQATLRISTTPAL